MNKKTNSCKDIKQMITWGKIENLPVSDLEQIRKHIESCPRCAGYAETFELIESVLQQESKRDQDALIAVKNTLLSRFASHEPSDQKDRFLRWIWEKLTWRVPVYQAAFAIILMIFITFAAIKGFESQEKKSVELQIIAGLTGLDTMQLNQLDNVGRNSLEDSTLIRIAVTTL